VPPGPNVEPPLLLVIASKNCTLNVTAAAWKKFDWGVTGQPMTLMPWKFDAVSQGRRKQFDIGPANPFLFPSLPPIHFLLSPFVVVEPSFFPPHSILPLPLIFASLPLEIGALNPARGSGADPKWKSNLVHFSIKCDI